MVEQTRSVAEMARIWCSDSVMVSWSKGSRGRERESVVNSQHLHEYISRRIWAEMLRVVQQDPNVTEDPDDPSQTRTLVEDRRTKAHGSPDTQMRHQTDVN